jgi:hypothetical protein
VRGSPIRTSSDQRSVGSSPRLIAASYVLHRLLVPRHPPCALNNLATQLQHTPHTLRAIPAYTYAESHRSAARACNQRRCSRPLCSSQRPTGHRPHRPAQPHPPATTGDATTGWYEDPNGPDMSSRPPPPACNRARVRSLRTQQRAYGPGPRPTTTFPTPVGAVLAAARRCRPNWSAFHPRAPPHTLRRHPQMGTDHGVGAALDHQKTLLAASAP